MVELTQDRRLGLEMEDEEAKKLLTRGADIRHSKDVKDLKYVVHLPLTEPKLTIWVGQRGRISFQTNRASNQSIVSWTLPCIILQLYLAPHTSL